MSVQAAEIETLTADLVIWSAYDSGVKAELFSCAVNTSEGIAIIDPIGLAPSALREVLQIAPVRATIVTNSNHERAVIEFAERLSAPIFAHVDSFPDKKLIAVNRVTDGDRILNDLTVITIDGAPPGEVAIHHPSNGGTLIVGDALINFEPLGFTFLPPKYCADLKRMKRSLRKLLHFKSERILFAHGTPILSKASERLQRLLESDPETAK